MGYYEKLLDLKKIRDLMLDDKSKILFDAKIDYMITRNREQFYNIIDALEKNWYCKELNEILARVDIKGIIIFGCGHDGKRTKKVLELPDEKIGYKIREARIEKIPYLLIVGEKEQESGSVSVRDIFNGDRGIVRLGEFIDSINEEILSKK